MKVSLLFILQAYPEGLNLKELKQEIDSRFNSDLKELLEDGVISTETGKFTLSSAALETISIKDDEETNAALLKVIKELHKS